MKQQNWLFGSETVSRYLYNPEMMNTPTSIGAIFRINQNNHQFITLTLINKYKIYKTQQISLFGKCNRNSYMQIYTMTNIIYSGASSFYLLKYEYTHVSITAIHHRQHQTSFFYKTPPLIFISSMSPDT